MGGGEGRASSREPASLVIFYCSFVKENGNFSTTAGPWAGRAARDSDEPAATWMIISHDGTVKNRTGTTSAAYNKRTTNYGGCGRRLLAHDSEEAEAAFANCHCRHATAMALPHILHASSGMLELAVSAIASL